MVIGAGAHSGYFLGLVAQKTLQEHHFGNISGLLRPNTPEIAISFRSARLRKKRKTPRTLRLGV